MWTDFKRIVRTGFVHFIRNGIVSIAPILIMTVTLFVVGSLIFMNALLDTTLEQIQNRVDVNIYFNSAADDGDVLAIKNSLDALAEVASVEYVSREQARDDFRERHKDDYLALQALEELDENPFPAALNVRAKETSQYESIARFLESRNALSTGGEIIIDKINYYQNKTVIDRLTKVISGAEKLGFAVTAVMALISVVIVFNTILLTIYVSREEISVMNLVGATPRYIRGPFIVEGMLYGIIASIIVMIFFYPATNWLGAITEEFFGGANIFDYYIGNFGRILGIITGSGILLGTLSSVLAVAKYLHR
ncbi:MAG: hypothetical protein COW88_02915 [Candidatus Lloydbacteria bacterium CG22_combo_CG10-13_8_21_14_all_47_15]|uniref:Cell division protein FtsX n=1 Tax=Candidatus Lloydbacteria bacterium CG22_combo_CG10-13_8_21_14_all_47_15 TaxID=1974635 RepID=A0A2H0CTF2_9BACT|nr:MAG: hypothetical protein COW88_02915 [Candidatus Lloydbacteria bacterium CG22_combo_CG10-13_8_21_14_all_47_15]